MDVAEILIMANKAVEAADVPKEFREVAFSKAIDIVAASQLQTGPSNLGNEKQRAAAPTNLNADGTDSVAQIADSLSIDLETAENVYAEGDDGIELVVPSSKLLANKTGAARQLALLLAYGRQAAGIEEYTTFATIRNVAEQYKRLDSKNFATAINGMQDAFVFRGKGSARSVKISRPGKELASKLVKELGELND